jgi:DNA methylase
MALAYDKKFALNAICPYFTMFPVEYPMRVLRKHARSAVGVLDPFCGRGTTLFAARKMGLSSWGIDTSPIACAIARAKLCRVDECRILALAADLLTGASPGAIPESPFFAAAYSKKTLESVCRLRSGLLALDRENDESIVLRAAALGCLHGPTSKQPESQSYFSNQMPRTYASKPSYAVNYWRRHRLKPRDVDVLGALRRKVQRIAETQLPPSKTTFRSVSLGDSRFAKHLPRDRAGFSVVVTSPPYYGMCTYVQDQWLRSWFLGGPAEVDYTAGEQLSHAGSQSFVESLGRVWRNMGRSTAEELHMYIRFGAIPSYQQDVKKILQESLESSGVAWNVISVRSAATSTSGKRQALQMTANSCPASEFDFHVLRA